MTTPKFYITTAISYPNGAPHVGHAYEALATDAIARFMRLDGRDVYFLTGTDEHGIKMKQTAAREGLEPRALADRNTALFQEMVRGARLLERRLHPHDRAAPLSLVARRSGGGWQAAGDIYKDAYAGWYSVRDEAYYAESETEVRAGQCPLRAAGHAGRMGRGGELLLPAVRLPGPAARPLRGASRFHRSRRAPERGGELRQGRPPGPVDLAHDLRLGHPGARRSRAT